MTNQNPEQIARDNIDRQLIACGWVIQDKNRINLGAGTGVAVREYQTDIGPADYILFVDRKPVGVIEAKREEEGVHMTSHEEQSGGYAASKLKHLNNDPLSFVYESTGTITHFTNFRDPKPRSRPVFTFHKPETFRELLKGERTLRKGLLDLPSLPTDGLRECQINAINNLEVSFKENRPRALIQMATGSGKTFTAITFIYRLLKYAGAKRILFLVDTRNLGEQAEQEFMAFQPNDDNRKFAELYGVHRLKSGTIPTDNQVYISTIQRLYSILKGEELDEAAEEENPNERRWQPKEPVPVVYNERLPPEFFDFVVIDECHRSIYNLWKQVLDYFDSFQIGLTATPDNRTFGYFNQNVVSVYGFEEAVTDGVLVPYNVFISSQFQRLIIKDAKGTAMLNLAGVKELELVPFSICSLPEQHQIVQEIESRLLECDNMESTIAASLQQTEALRQSVLKKAFEGRLLNEKALEAVRQDPAWESAERLLERIRAEKAVFHSGKKGRKIKE